MYRQFCKNLINYNQLNNSDDYRSLIGKEFMILLDKNKFNEMKNNNVDRFLNILYKENNRKCNKFLWELYAYGFEISLEKIKKDQNVISNKKDIDKVELLKLLLGTTYWN